MHSRCTVDVTQDSVLQATAADEPAGRFGEGTQARTFSQVNRVENGLPAAQHRVGVEIRTFSPVKQRGLNPVMGSIPVHGRQFFRGIIKQMQDGERPVYEKWRRLDVQPDDPTCMECFDEDAFDVL